jgi:DNA-binding IclR family transcriptional regulator
MSASSARMAATGLMKKPSLSIVGQPGTFNAIQKVCAILRVLAQRSPLRLTEIADATSLNKATTLRILGSLIEEGFVSRVTGAKTYELGQEARVMAISARRTVDIAELAQPSLLRLSEKSADTSLLSVRSGVEALYLARSVGSHPLQPNSLQLGSRRPLGVGAGSLALMVWLPDAEIDAIIEVIVPRLAKSPRITPKYLRERIIAARKHGHTVLIDAAYPGMGGVGVPVRDETGQVVAALSIGASSDRIRRRETELAEMLKKEALILSRAMAQPAKPNSAKAIIKVS